MLMLLGIDKSIIYLTILNISHSAPVYLHGLALIHVGVDSFRMHRSLTAVYSLF